MGFASSGLDSLVGIRCSTGRGEAMQALSGSPYRGRHSTRPIHQLVIVMITVAVATIACGSSADTTEPGNTTAVSSPAPATATSPHGASTTATPTSPHGPSAADQLADFLTGAQRMDDRLRSTAKMINSGLGAETFVFTPDTVAAIKAIDPETLVKTMPAGMSAQLQHQMYLLFSELAARRYAFTPILEQEVGTAIPRDSDAARHIMEGLSRGSSPAGRFPHDLAATRTLAQSEPPVPVAAPDSRASAEVAVHAAYIVGRNNGCGASGGWVQTTEVPLVWKQGTNGVGRTDGTIGDVQFRADYQPGQGWQVALNAC